MAARGGADHGPQPAPPGVGDAAFTFEREQLRDLYRTVFRKGALEADERCGIGVQQDNQEFCGW